MPGRCYAVITAAGRLCFRCSQRHRAPHRSLAGGVAPDVVERAVLMQPGVPPRNDRHLKGANWNSRRGDRVMRLERDGFMLIHHRALAL
jgi:hypothetical protein